MILKALVVAAGLIAAVLIFAATRPNTFRVQRSIEINAPAEKIFALIDDFHNWSRWSPQDREDSTMSRTYSGPAHGVGAGSEWESAGKAGKGRMSIAESAPPTEILVKVDFVKPFEAHNVNEFTLQPAGAFTKVTWTMQGKNLYVMKIMGIFVSMDRVMGKHFEAGLDNLKIAAEK
jgi:carbon monoxide dehydrogenase subunit G